MDQSALCAQCFETKVGEVDQNGRPLATAQTAARGTRPTARRHARPIAILGATIVNDADYRAQRLE
jgi:hypothetical protein